MRNYLRPNLWVSIGRAISLLFLGTLIGGLATRPVVGAAPSRGVTVLPPHSMVEGKTIEEWSADWWKWAYSMGASTNSLYDTNGMFAHNGQTGSVFFIGGNLNISTPIVTTREITITDDKYLFFPLVNVEWENIGVEPPWKEAELRDLIIRTVSAVDDVHAFIDGAPVTNLFAYREVSPEFNFRLPPVDNVFGGFVSGVIDPVVSDGYWLMLAPLSLGHHTLRFGGGVGSPFDFHVDAIYKIKVIHANAALKGDNANQAQPPPGHPEARDERRSTALPPSAKLSISTDEIAPQSREFASTPRKDFWVPDGEVHAIVETNGVIYVGGDFSYLGPNADTGASFDAFSGSADPDFPKVNGAVHACVIDGAGGWIIGGQFSTLGGVARRNLARVRPDKTVDPYWHADTDGAVLALLLSGNRLYVGGTFSHIGGLLRNNAAALDQLTGTVTEWNPDVSTSLKRCSVRSLAIAGNRIYIAGSFNYIGGEPRENLGSVDLEAGEVTEWLPLPEYPTEALNTINAVAVVNDTAYVGGSFGTLNAVVRANLAAFDIYGSNQLRQWNPKANGPVYALAVSCDTIYIGGSFTAVGGKPRGNLAAAKLSGDVLDWNPQANGLVRSVLLSGSTAYVGGQFRSIGGVPTEHIAALDILTGAARTWEPQADFDVGALAVSGGAIFAGGRVSPGGVERKNIAALNARTGQPLMNWNPKASGAVHALAISSNTLFLGGDFTEVGGTLRHRLAAVDVHEGTPTAWDPDVNGLVRSNQIVKSFAIAGETLFVGGTFTNVGAYSRHRLAAFDLRTGELLPWNPGADDDVYSLVAEADTLFVGGRFRYIAGQLRRRLASLNTITGWATTWNPVANDVVRTLAVAEESLYVGGGFTQMGEQTRQTLSAIDSAVGNTTSWDPALANTNVVNGLPLSTYIYAVAVSGARLYAGGFFNQLGGRPRNNLGAVALADGDVSAWRPDPDSYVHSLSAGNGALYAGGSFSTMGGEHQPGLAAFPPEGAPVIVRQPRSQGSSIGQSVTFDVQASGVGPLVYAWQFNGIPIPGANSTNLTVNDVQLSESGEYSAIVTNALGLISSRSATLTVRQEVRILTQPISQTAEPGATVTLAVVATGSPRPTYQWRLNGVNIPGATAPSFTISNAQPRDGGSYDVMVANLTGVIASSNAVILVNATPLAFADSLADRETRSESAGIFSGTNFSATKEPWEQGHAGKRGGKSVWLAWIPPASGIATFSTRGSDFDTLLGIYTNSAMGTLGEVASDEDHGGFLTSRASFNAVAGTEYLVAVDGFAGRSGDIVLSWELDTSTVEFPRINLQPVSQTVRAGDEVTFSVSAFSATALRYQWFFRCESLPGETNATLTISDVGPDNLGPYRVLVMNASTHIAESTEAFLEIGPQANAISRAKFEDALEDLRGAAVAAASRGFLASARALSTSGSAILVRLGTIDSQLLNSIGSPGSPSLIACAGSSQTSRKLSLQCQESGTMQVDTIGSKIATLLVVWGAQLPNGIPKVVNCDVNSAPGGKSLLQFPAQADYGYVVVAGGAGTDVGDININWKLGLLPTPSGHTQLPDTIPMGTSIDVCVNASSYTPDLTFQWLQNGQKLLGRTNQCLRLEDIQLSDAGIYEVLVRNFVGATNLIIGEVRVGPPIRLEITNGISHVRLGGPTNQNLEIQVSSGYALHPGETNLSWHWETLFRTNLPPSTPLDFIDPILPNIPMRVYRIHVP